jgi:MscS family membrane protein
LFFAFTNTTNAADVNPLRPVDTSSPRATMQNFVETVDEIYRGIKDVMQNYAASGRLYLTPRRTKKAV